MNWRRQSGYFQFEEVFFAENSQKIGKIFLEVLLIMKFLKSKPQDESMDINCYDFFYTVDKNLTEEGENCGLIKKFQAFCAV